jgi:hypothetical protein
MHLALAIVVKILFTSAAFAGKKIVTESAAPAFKRGNAIIKKLKVFV